MKDFLFSLIQAIIIAAVPVITAYLCKYLNALKQESTEAVANDVAKGLLEDAYEAVITAVTYTNQTYVDTLKSSGTFSVENQKEAFTKSFDTAQKLMTQEAKDFIAKAYGSLSEWLSVQIEAEVKEQKE